MSLPKSKDEIVSHLHAQIDGASRKIDEWKLQTALGKAEARDALQERIASLEEHRDRLKGKLEHLSNSAGDAWQELAEGCERSWQELKEAVSKAMGEFKP